MRISQKGIDLIKRHEGLAKLRNDGKVESYPDAGYGWKVATIGYGTTRGVKKGMVITKEEAEQLLIRDLGAVENTIERMVKVPLNDNHVSALASFIYNVGAGAFEKSTLLKELNKGNYHAVPGQLARYKYSNGKVFAGLVRRRADEAQLWNTPVDIHPEPEPTPETTPSVAEPDNGKPVKKIVRDSWTIKGLFLAFLAWLSSAYDWAVSLLGSGAEVAKDLDQTLGPWDAFLKVAGANMAVIALVIGLIGLTIALIRRIQAGKSAKEG